MKKTMSCIALGGALVPVLATVAFAATYDFSEEWSYSTSQHWHDRYCPPGGETTGVATISQDDETFLLTIDDGMLCEPAWTCTFDGFVSEDGHYIGLTGGELDTVEGSGVGIIEFKASSFSSASGQFTYTIELEDDDISCSWGFHVELSGEGFTFDEVDSNQPLDENADLDPFDGSNTDPKQGGDCRIAHGSGTSVVVELIVFLLSALVF